MAVSNLVGKGAKKSVRIRKWLRITALFMAVWVVCAAAVAEGAALPEESASVQAEASDGQPAQVPQEGAPPEGAEPRLSCWDFTTAPVRASMSYSYSLPLA